MASSNMEPAFAAAAGFGTARQTLQISTYMFSESTIQMKVVSMSSWQANGIPLTWR